MIPLSPATVESMRAWIGECVWGDLEPEDMAELSPAQVIRGVRRHYLGGITAFLKDGVAA